MRRTIASITAAAIAVTSIGATLPAQAAGVAVPQAQVQQVAQHGVKPHFYMQHNRPYLNGHRGDSHWHSGWRQYNGYWFPPAAFVGLLIGGAILGGILSHAY